MKYSKEACLSQHHILDTPVLALTSYYNISFSSEMVYGWEQLLARAKLALVWKLPWHFKFKSVKSQRERIEMIE